MTFITEIDYKGFSKEKLFQNCLSVPQAVAVLFSLYFVHMKEVFFNDSLY